MNSRNSLGILGISGGMRSTAWINTHVIITALGSPLKGYVGVVTDVLPGQDTVSGLRIAVQLAHYDPSSPFKKMTFDYDDVVEERSVSQ